MQTKTRTHAHARNHAHTWRSSKSLFSSTIKLLDKSHAVLGNPDAPCCDIGKSTLSARWFDAIMSQSLIARE